MTDGEDGDEVGYGKPPKKHQFKKGQSGNAKGRPTKNRRRKHDAYHSLILEQFAEEIKVTLDGQATGMTIDEALRKSLVAKALKGNMVAIKLSLDLHSDARMAVQESRKRLFLLAARYKAGWEAEFHYLGRKSLLKPPVPIQPSSILIDFETCEVRIQPGTASVDGKSNLGIVDPSSLIEMFESCPPPPARQGHDELSAEEKRRRLAELIATGKPGRLRT